MCGPGDIHTNTAGAEDQRRSDACRSQSKVIAWARAGEEETGWTGGTTLLTHTSVNCSECEGQSLSSQMIFKGPIFCKIHFTNVFL